MIISVTSDNGLITVTTPENGDRLVYPDPSSNWGSPLVTFNDNKIPSAKIWELLSLLYIDPESFSYEALMEEAKRANIYRLVEQGTIIWTLDPNKEDKQLGGHVYVRVDKQRIRVLLPKFGIRIAKVDGPLDKEVLQEIFQVCETLGFYPVGMVDERIYVSKDPEAVFEAFGSRDWQRIGVYCKRPSASGFQLNLV